MSNDWRNLVAYLRAELHRYYPDCPTYDIGVHRRADDALELSASPDGGETEMKWIQSNVDDSDAEYFVFSSLTFLGRILTIPFPPETNNAG